MERLLPCLDLPSGLRNLTVAELEQVAAELRDELIETVSSSGGHFASSLGATELTVALHHAFDTPHDRLVWDVGHQAYVHKMLTGRRSELATIRTKGGLSGFLKRSESEFDTFGAGHAGTSISAAVGMSTALRRIDPSRYVVAVIGDGSMTAGMAFEALNHAGSMGLKNFIVVLNDNEMSISPNVGAVSWLFSRAVTSRASNCARRSFKNLYHKGYVPQFVYKAIDRAEEAAQGFFASAAMLFESFGLRYIGPVDGHNIGDLLTAIEHAKQQEIPVIIHAYTSKGKGYEPAEEDPLKWHGVTPFDRDRGEFRSGGASVGPKIPTYTSIFGSTMVRLARENSNIIGITAAMSTGTGLDMVEQTLPDQFFDVGICEQHAVTFAAGLACEGFRPVCAIYSTFLQRAYDQVIHDVCIQNLPVVFALDRGGAVGNDGETHQGAFDIAYLRTLPNMVLMSPKDENELQHMLATAVEHPGPIAIRYPRGNGAGVPLDSNFEMVKIGKGEILSRGDAALLICYGPTVQVGVAIAKKIREVLGREITVVNARFAKPLDSALLRAELPHYPFILTLEDHSLQGGFGSAILEFIQEEGVQISGSIERFGMQDAFTPHASQAEQYAMNGYSFEQVLQHLLERILPQRRVAQV